MGSGAKDMRAERDRFVAFAFSAADLMLEIAGDGSVLFVSGAARLLTGEDSDRLTGRQFSSLIDEADRHFILNLLEIGRASCRERVCPYVSISVVPVSLKKNKHIN